MKTFFTRNRRIVEIFLTLLLVFLAAGYYYLIYIPARENEIIERRFRTLQRIERNMQEKMQGYLSTIKNCVARGDESFFQDIVKAYNKEPEKFRIKVVKKDIINKEAFRKLNQDSLMGAFVDSLYDSTGFNALSSGRKMMITYNWRKLKRDSTIINVTVEGLINYKEFVAPLLRKRVFDHYLVFNVSDKGANNINSNVVYEDFPSGISFNDVDSLFDAKEKVYTSRIIKIETGGEKYLAFLHPCGYNKKNERIVAGLLREESFNKEKQQLPEKMVTAILFIALFTFLLLPVIRLALLGRKERIRLFDVFAVYFSFLLLVPVLILLVFWNRARLIPNKSPRAESKQVLANQISRSLLSELDTAYALLHTMDSIHEKDDGLKIIDTFNIRYLGKNEARKATVHDLKDTSNNNKTAHVSAVAKLDSLLSGKPLFNNTEGVFWVDAHSGNEIANWAFDEDPPRGNYKGREYFTNARDAHKLIFLDDSGLRHFAIQPLVSRTDGKFKFVIARRSFTDTLIVASASRLSSVINPVLPMGFSFCVTDASGNIIFDADTTHNLNENLLEEFTDPASFKAALDTKTSREFKTRYEDEEQSVLVQPIPRLPYFIVISENGSFESSLNTQCFSFTMVMMFSYFLFLCIEIIIVLVCHLRETKLLKNKLDLSWIYPRENMSTKYFILSVFNLGMLIVLGLFCFICFSIQRITEYFFLFAMAALLSTVAAGFYRSESKRAGKIEPTAEKGHAVTIVALTFLAVIVLFSSLKYSYDIFEHVLLFSTASIVLFVLLKGVTGRLDNNSYLVNYRLMVFSKLLLTSGVPVIVFFMCIYNFEQRLEERVKLLNYAENIANRSKSDQELVANLRQMETHNGIKSFYADSLWIAEVKEARQGIKNTGQQYAYADSISISLLKTSRVHYNDVSGTTENFELTRPFGTDHFFFNSIFSDSGNVLTYHVTNMSDEYAVKKTIKLSSSPAKAWRAPCSLPAGLIFLVILFGVLILCYQLFKYATNKIFGNNIPSIADFKARYEKLLTDENIRYLWVQGIPGGETTALIKKQMKLTRKANHNKKCNAIFFSFNGLVDETQLANERQQYEEQMADLNLLQKNDILEMAGNYKVMTLPKVLARPQQTNWYAKIQALSDEQVDCIVFTDLEYNMLNADANRMKLNLVEKFVYEGKKRIIVTSGFNHIEFINGINKNTCSPLTANNHKIDAKKESKEATNEQEVANASCFEYIHRWNNLFGKFTNVYIDNHEFTASANKQAPVSTAFSETELSSPVFLNKYKEQFKAFSEESKTEDNILMVHSLSEQPYRQIWASLTHEEQLIVYDLAEDGLVNTANVMPLTVLLNKGLLLKKDGVLSIVNRSFRNFVLTSVNPGEVKNIEKEINDGQTWNDYKYPVLIFIGGLVYFVLSSSPEKFGNVLPLISGLMAGIPTLLKLLSYLKPSESKS